MSQSINAKWHIGIRSNRRHCCWYGYETLKRKLTCSHYLNTSKLSHARRCYTAKDIKQSRTTTTTLARQQDKENSRQTAPLFTARIHIFLKKTKKTTTSFPRLPIQTTLNPPLYLSGVVKRRNDKKGCCQPAHRQTAWWWRFVYTELAGLASPLPRAAESKKKPRNSLTELLGILTAHHIYRAAFHHTERGIQTLPSASTAESTTVRPRWPADYGSPCCFDSHN